MTRFIAISCLQISLAKWMSRSMTPADEPCVLERLEAVLQPIMWRNDKVSVGNELKLPPRSLDVSCPFVCTLMTCQRL